MEVSTVQHQGCWVLLFLAWVSYGTGLERYLCIHNSASSQCLNLSRGEASTAHLRTIPTLGFSECFFIIFIFGNRPHYIAMARLEFHM